MPVQLTTKLVGYLMKYIQRKKKITNPFNVQLNHVKWNTTSQKYRQNAHTSNGEKALIPRKFALEFITQDMVSWVFIRNKSATKLVSDKVDDDIEQHFHLPSNDITRLGIALHGIDCCIPCIYHQPAQLCIYRTFARSSETFNLKQYPNAIQTTFSKTLTKWGKKSTNRHSHANEKKDTHTSTFQM